MLSILFKLGTQLIEVKVIPPEVYFAEVKGHKGVFVPIDRLKLSRNGIIKEFPDLASYDEEDMKREAIKRFKAKIAKMDKIEEIGKYIINELRPYGYIPTVWQKNGFRPIPL